jgi:hypothetical protein
MTAGGRSNTRTRRSTDARLVSAFEGLATSEGDRVSGVASWTLALQRLDEAIAVTDRQRRIASHTGNEELRRTMRDLLDELHTLKRELRSLKREFER